MFLLCRLGFHDWPRLHGNWRDPVVEPAESNCTRCAQPIRSIWRVVYPRDGGKCRPGTCQAYEALPLSSS
jgi:hypothetical protein